MIYFDWLFHRSWAFAKADQKVFVKKMQDKTLFASAAAKSFKTCVAHLLCLDSFRFTILLLCVTSLSKSYLQNIDKRYVIAK